jgi:hypothetical protein
MRDRPALTAGFAVVVLVVGQLAALAHAAAARHVVCEEHGEQIEAPTLVGAPAAGDASEHARFIGVEGQGAEHEDCAILRVLRPGIDASRNVPVITAAPLVTVALELPPANPVAVAVDLVLIAPKTSPPV